jgi:hypothetical protein
MPRAVSREGLYAGNRSAQDQCVDVMCAFIGVDRLEILRVPHHMELGGEMASRFAAFSKWSSSATATKYLRWRNSIFMGDDRIRKP